MAKTAAHKRLEAFNHSKKLVIACYELTRDLPTDEKSNFSRYIRTAALDLHIKVAQGAFLKSKKRKTFIREAKSALVIIDAATEILVDLGMATQQQVDVVTRLSSGCYQLLDEL